MQLTYVKADKIWIKEYPGLNEAWVRDRIAADPSLLGLGDLDVRDIEHTLPKAGRLDLLLSDSENERWYEVELMLGSVDESHIIRTIEYWDVERRRYPQYQHIAVLIAEDITSRFLNVISLFNNAIPMIAIQMNALQLNNQVLLHFTRVLDVVFPADEPPDIEVTDRSYWEKLSSSATLEMVDSSLEILHNFNPALRLNYKKRYIGLVDQQIVNNFIVFRARKTFMGIRALLTNRQEWRQRLDNAGIVTLPDHGNRLCFKLTMEEFNANRSLLTELYEQCFAEQQD